MFGDAFDVEGAALVCLHAEGVRDAHAGDERFVLTVAFVAAAEARIAGDVKTGAKTCVMPIRAASSPTVLPIAYSSSQSKDAPRAMPDGKQEASEKSSPHSPSMWKMAGM